MPLSGTTATAPLWPPATRRTIGWTVNLLPRPPGRALDVGAGTGRDAAWLARLGFQVVAVEPSGVLRGHAIGIVSQMQQCCEASNW